MTLVHIDTETTGLDPKIHQICEVAWAIDDGPVKYGKVRFNESSVDPEAMEINKFYERQADLPLVDLLELREDLKFATLVGMNVQFDSSFLENLIPKVWYYRMLDIESYAAGILNLDSPPSSREIARILENDYNIALNNYSDHTARGDVIAQREIFDALGYLSEELHLAKVIVRDIKADIKETLHVNL